MILNVAYRITIKESDDPYISTAEIALNGFAEAGDFVRISEISAVYLLFQGGRDCTSFSCGDFIKTTG